MTLTLNTATATHVGLVRSGNEDSVLALENTLVVADGMGGAAGGEIASKFVVDQFASEARAGRSSIFDAAQMRLLLSMAHRGITDIARESLRAFLAGEPGELLRGMGTTAVAASFHLAGDDPAAHVVHCGDSRAYVFADGMLARITRDHTVYQDYVDRELAADAGELAELKKIYGHVLTRALGGDEEGNHEPDMTMIPVRAGQRFLLCSDGLHDMLTDIDIHAHLAVTTASPEQIAEALIESALAAGGHDNISVAIADVD